jgi:hypothetical protein
MSHHLGFKLSLGALLLVLSAGARAAAENARAATPPPAAKANSAPDPKSIAAVNAAAAVLVKEAQAGLSESGAATKPKLREKSDYFGATPPAAITPDAIVMALDRTQSSDARVDAYVKWQLLSAVPGKFATELVPKALGAYRHAPEPYSHPGLDRSRLQSMLFRIGITKKESIGPLNEEFGGAIAKFNKQNEYVLRYRNDMYAHLPGGDNGDAMMAGLEDVFTRVRHGVNSKDIWDAVSSSMQGWSVTAEARQRNAMIGALESLLATVRSDRYKPFVKVTWNDDPKTGGLRWQEEAALWDKPIQDQIDSMKEAAKLMETAGFKDKK